MRSQDTEKVTRCQAIEKTRKRSGRKRGQGNWARGEQSGSSRLTEDQVREIRRRWEGGESTHKIGREYDVTAQTVLNIVRRRSWGHVR